MSNIFIYKVRQIISALHFQQSCEHEKKTYIKELVTSVTEAMTGLLSVPSSQSMDLQSSKHDTDFRIRVRQMRDETLAFF